MHNTGTANRARINCQPRSGFAKMRDTGQYPSVMTMVTSRVTLMLVISSRGCVIAARSNWSALLPALTVASNALCKLRTRPINPARRCWRGKTAVKDVSGGASEVGPAAERINPPAKDQTPDCDAAPPKLPTPIEMRRESSESGQFNGFCTPERGRREGVGTCLPRQG